MIRKYCKYGKLRGRYRHIPLTKKGCDMGYPCIYVRFSPAGKFCCNYTKKFRVIKKLQQCPMGLLKWNFYTSELSGDDLILSGDDAIDFIEYLKNPTYTVEANECMRKILIELGMDYKHDEQN
jgi:hypothetical protein